MARRKSSKSKSHSTFPRRDAHRITTRVQRVPTLYIQPQSVIKQIDDRRTFHPLSRARPLRTLRARPAVVKKVFKRGIRKMLHQLSPEALVCVRRKTRREVIFAGGYGGRRGQRSPRFNQTSNFRC